MATCSEKIKPVRCGCGGEAQIETVTTRFEQKPRFRIICEKCKISTIWDYFSEAEAITAWNRAMGNVQECAKDARCKERTAKAEWSEVDGCHLCGECGFAVCPNCDVYCAGCGAKLDWNEDIPMEYFESGGR